RGADLVKRPSRDAVGVAWLHAGARGRPMASGGAARRSADLRIGVGVSPILAAIVPEHGVDEVVVGIGPIALVIGTGPERVVEQVVVGVGPEHRAGPGHE